MGFVDFLDKVLFPFQSWGFLTTSNSRVLRTFPAKFHSVIRKLAELNLTTCWGLARHKSRTTDNGYDMDDFDFVPIQANGLTNDTVPAAK